MHFWISVMLLIMKKKKIGQLHVKNNFLQILLVPNSTQSHWSYVAHVNLVEWVMKAFQKNRQND